MSGPKAARPVFPFPGHRSMAEVMRDEAAAAKVADAFAVYDDPEIENREYRAGMRRGNAKFVKALGVTR